MTESVAVFEIFASKGRFGKDGIIIIIIKRIVPKLENNKRFRRIRNLFNYIPSDGVRTLNPGTLNPRTLNPVWPACHYFMGIGLFKMFWRCFFCQ